MDSTEGGSPSKDAANVADAVAGHIRHALQTPFTIHGNEVYVGVSTGVAVYPTHGEDAEALLSAARAAMTEARANGRGGGVSDRHASDQLKLTTRLRHAVNHDEFVLHYQPVCDISRGLIVGVEALIRWMDPERGMIAPNQFIHLAERTGMITQISDWVVTEACRQSRAWRDQGVRVGVSVNLPPILWQPAMVHRLRAEVANAGLKPNEFMIEITESAIMTDPDRSQTDPAGALDTTAFGWRSTTSVPATRRSRGCARCRSRHSRSIARSSPTCPATRTPRRWSRRSSSWPRTSDWWRWPRASRPRSSCHF